jgi:hypothetical protein
MRKKSLLAVAVVLLLAVGMAAMSVTSAAAPSSSRLHGWAKPSANNASAATTAAEAAAKAKDVTRLVLIVRSVDEVQVDVPPEGEENPGDSALVTEDAFTPAGRRVGYNQVRFTVMFRQEDFVEATFILQGRGQIVVEGGFSFTEQRPALAVVGGTGEFHNARGQMFVLPGPTPEETKLVFALRL